MSVAHTEATAIATALLHREADCLDRRDWDAWLALYATDAVYWVPAWRDEQTPTEDPEREISQIYHDSRRGLEERVMRVRSGKSVVALPLPRTVRFITNIAAQAPHPACIEARANWLVQLFEPRTGRQHANFGHCELVLVPGGEGWLIRRKKILLQNDLVPALLDFFTL